MSWLDLADRWRTWMYQRGSAKMVWREGRPYLERFYLLALRGRRLFLHVFWMSDPDPLHCHPWPWGRIIVWGRYREWHHDGAYTECGPGHVVWHKTAHELHRVELLTPFVVTLFWHWKRTRKRWGFMYNGGWRPAPDEGQDGRPLRGVVFPRKVGETPKEIVHKER